MTKSLTYYIDNPPKEPKVIFEVSFSGKTKRVAVPKAAADDFETQWKASVGTEKAFVTLLAKHGAEVL